MEEHNQENTSLQEQIENVITEEAFRYKKIIDFDIVDRFIFAVSLKANGGLDLFLIEYDNGELEWIAGGNDATIVGLDEDTFPIAYLIQPDESDVNQVNVFGEPAKAVTYHDEKTEEYTREIKYWIAYTQKSPAPSDVEYIKN